MQRCWSRWLGEESPAQLVGGRLWMDMGRAWIPTHSYASSFTWHSVPLKNPGYYLPPRDAVRVKWENTWGPLRILRTCLSLVMSHLELRLRDPLLRFLWSHRPDLWGWYMSVCHIWHSAITFSPNKWLQVLKTTIPSWSGASLKDS